MLTMSTDKNEALSLAAKGLAAIERYLDDGGSEALDDARVSLESATKIDPEYYLPLYYLALIEFTLHKYANSARRFEFVSKNAPNDKIRQESHDNSVAAKNYALIQKIGRLSLDTSNFRKSSLRSETEQPLPLKALENLRSLHASAIAARTQALSGIRVDPEILAANDQERQILWEAEMGAISLAEKVISSTARFSSSVELVIKKETEKPRVVALNALAKANMFLTDYFFETHEKLRRLRKAQSDLEKCGKLFPDDWVIHCDLGACHLRLGYWEQSADEFATARQYLDKVSDKSGLRPGYGLALYQIGRIHRLRGEFDSAMELLEHVGNLSEPRRDVPAFNLDHERRLVRAKSTTYP
jgi:tetratricopeptide (TPR) repeat protein